MKDELHEYAAEEGSSMNLASMAAGAGPLDPATQAKATQDIYVQKLAENAELASLASGGKPLTPDTRVQLTEDIKTKLSKPRTHS